MKLLVWLSRPWRPIEGHVMVKMANWRHFCGHLAQPKDINGSNYFTLAYGKVASRNRSRLCSSTPKIFRLFRMKGKFDACVLWPLAKKVKNWIVARVYCSRLYGNLKSSSSRDTFRPVCRTQATFMDQKLASELLQSKPDGTTLLTTKEERLLIYFIVLPGLLHVRGFIYTFINLE